jgi:hypothetical protein
MARPRGAVSHHPWRSPLRGAAWGSDQNGCPAVLSNRGSALNQKALTRRALCIVWRAREELFRTIPGAHPCGALPGAATKTAVLPFCRTRLDHRQRFESSNRTQLPCCPFTSIGMKLARPEGFEPPTTGVGSQYSIQLSYGRMVGALGYRSVGPASMGLCGFLLLAFGVILSAI